MRNVSINQKQMKAFGNPVSEPEKTQQTDDEDDDK